MSNLFSDLQKARDEQRKLVTPQDQTTGSKPTREVTHKPTQTREPSREKPRDRSRAPSRGKSRELPTRDEIQEFSFRLRDALKVKVQAEVPHHWQRELDDIARELDVKKLELYRFIIGEFLGKVKRKKAV